MHDLRIRYSIPYSHAVRVGLTESGEGTLPGAELLPLLSEAARERLARIPADRAYSITPTPALAATVRGLALRFATELEAEVEADAAREASREGDRAAAAAQADADLEALLADAEAQPVLRHDGAGVCEYLGRVSGGEVVASSYGRQVAKSGWSNRTVVSLTCPRAAVQIARGEAHRLATLAAEQAERAAQAAEQKAARRWLVEILLADGAGEDGGDPTALPRFDDGVLDEALIIEALKDCLSHHVVAAAEHSVGAATADSPITSLGPKAWKARDALRAVDVRGCLSAAPDGVIE